jgi:hypothetical protein
MHSAELTQGAAAQKGILARHPSRRKEIRNPKAEILTWRSQNQRGKRATAEYAEYAEQGPLSSWVSVYSAYSAVQDRSHLGFNFTRTKRRLRSQSFRGLAPCSILRPQSLPGHPETAPNEGPDADFGFRISFGFQDPGVCPLPHQRDFRATASDKVPKAMKGWGGQEGRPIRRHARHGAQDGAAAVRSPPFRACGGGRGKANSSNRWGPASSGQKEVRAKRASSVSLMILPWRTS